jgi:hypothetical protein
MAWTVAFHEDFAAEFKEFDRDVKIELRAITLLLADKGPNLGRPWADTLNGSAFPNMKELRFEAVDGAWRAAFAFDPERKAIILVAGDKSGMSPKKFYRRLIDKADRRYRSHLDDLKKDRK